MSGFEPGGPGVRLGASVAVADLVLAYGGQAMSEAAGRYVERLVRPEDATEASDLVLVSRGRQVRRALEGPGVLLADARLASRLDLRRCWRVDDARRALARLLIDHCEPATAGASGELVGAGTEPARLGARVRVGFGALIHESAQIGDECVIGEHVVIHRNVRLGARVVVGASSVVGRCGFGWVGDGAGGLLRMPHPSGVVLGDDVQLGALCSVDAGVLAPTRIGRGSRLDAQVHVGHNVEIGEDCLIAAQVGFAGSVVLGDQVLVGGQAGFADGVHVGRAARIGAKSGVVGDVAAGASVAGFPAVTKARWLRGMALLLRRPARATGS